MLGGAACPSSFLGSGDNCLWAVLGPRSLPLVTFVQSRLSSGLGLRRALSACVFALSLTSFPFFLDEHSNCVK